MSNQYPHKVTPDPGSGACLLCGSTDNPTREHIIPQALWKRFGIDPNRDDLAPFWSTLCVTHNKATSTLHSNRTDMLNLIETGVPGTKKTLMQLADWAIWVTLLLGLERGSGVLGPDESRRLLLRRFDDGKSIRGIRVYAARVAQHTEQADPPIATYALALYGDSRVVLGADNKPNGFSIHTGPMNASESIAVGKLALLVVGSSYSSGADHYEPLDRAAGTVGLRRIHPLDTPPPALGPVPVSMKDVSQVFTVVPFDVDMSLMPVAIQAMMGSFDQA
jgi:hypothetical protein